MQNIKTLFILSFLLFNYNLHTSAFAEEKMTRDEVCEFVTEGGGYEEDRITTDKIEDSKKIVLSLIDYMQHGDDDSCVDLSIDLLGRTHDKRALEPLLAIFHDKQRKHRSYVIQALGNLGDARAVEPLIIELQKKRKPHDQTGYLAAAALGNLKDARAVDPLIQTLRSDEYARGAAVRALGEIKDKRAVEPLIVVFKGDSNELVRQAAVEALGEMEDVRAVDVLVAVLYQEQTNSGRFGFIIRALGKQKDQHSKDALVAAYKRIKDPSAKSHLSLIMKDAGIVVDDK